MTSSSLSLKVVLGGLVLSALQVVSTAPPAAAAAVRWASPTGTGTDCSQVAPCNLDTAVEDASVQDGDEVVVMPGAYDVVNLQVSDAITLHGEVGQPRPTITTNDVFAVFVTDAATLRDLNFVHEANSYGVSANAAGVVVERVTSRSTAAAGMACTPYASSTWRDTVCWATGTNTRGMGTNGMPAPGAYALTLRNLTIVGETSGLGIDVDAGITMTIDAKNVVASSAGDDIRALATHGGTVQITMASSNYADALALVGAGGGTATVTEPGTGTNQTAAPLFADGANGDFHQAEGSPTIDAGVLDGSTGTTDFEGDPRAARGPAGCPARPDIGADERVTALECDPPETSIANGPGATTTDTTPTFDLLADEPGVTFECRVDAEAFAPCTTPYTTAVLALGAHTVDARATDPSGNVDDTPATRSFTVVAPVVTPDTTLTKTPKKKVRTTKRRAKVTFAFTSTTPGGFECSLDGARFAPCASPLTFKAKLGKHQMRVRAVSDVGVVDPTPATYTFKVKRKR